MKLCPGASEFSALVNIRAGIMANLVGHHIGASYITGAPRSDYSDASCDMFLGRLGTYIQRMFAKSTLAQSPHLVQSKVKSYEDYPPEWDSALVQFKLAAAQSRQQAVGWINPK